MHELVVVLLSLLSTAGLELNVYSGNCPPDQVPDHHFDFSWDDVDATFYLEYPPSQLVVYEATVTLPYALVLETETSIAARVTMGWGRNPPFCGFASTLFDATYGCGEMYWDAPYNTPPTPRWTMVSVATGDRFDLAYCLESARTSVPDLGSPPDRPPTWGSIKQLYR